jgi:hypothetical protein
MCNLVALQRRSAHIQHLDRSFLNTDVLASYYQAEPTQFKVRIINVMLFDSRLSFPCLPFNIIGVDIFFIFLFLLENFCSWESLG